MIKKGDTMAKLFHDIQEIYNKNEIEKFNPFHDSLGRFSTGPNATSFTYKPGASKAHNRAIAREVVRTGKLGSNVRMVGTNVDEDTPGTNVYNPKTKDGEGGELIGNAIRQYNRTERMTNDGTFESARERKNRFKREKRSQKNGKTVGTTSGSDTKKTPPRNVAAQNRKGNEVYHILQGNKRPRAKKKSN